MTVSWMFEVVEVRLVRLRRAIETQQIRQEKSPLLGRFHELSVLAEATCEGIALVSRFELLLVVSIYLTLYVVDEASNVDQEKKI